MKNVADNTIKDALPNAVNMLKKGQKANRTTQLYLKGTFPLPHGSSTVIEITTGIPDGSIYYATDLGKNRKKEAGVWSNM